ncbi:MAG: DNA alkylation response protein, partial [Microlunatus sp.]|nr:DNA alkylation response protein [Microlunatus sp.]
AELAVSRGTHDAYDRALTELDQQLATGLEPTDARRVSGQLAVVLQASLLLRSAPGPISDAFCATRLGPQPFGVVGSGVPRTAVDAVLALR